MKILRLVTVGTASVAIIFCAWRLAVAIRHRQTRWIIALALCVVANLANIFYAWSRA